MLCSKINFELIIQIYVQESFIGFRLESWPFRKDHQAATFLLIIGINKNRNHANPIFLIFGLIVKCEHDHCCVKSNLSKWKETFLKSKCFLSKYIFWYRSPRSLPKDYRSCEKWKLDWNNGSMQENYQIWKYLDCSCTQNQTLLLWFWYWLLNFKLLKLPPAGLKIFTIAIVKNFQTVDHKTLKSGWVKWKKKFLESEYYGFKINYEIRDLLVDNAALVIFTFNN